MNTASGIGKTNYRRRPIIPDQLHERPLFAAVLFLFTAELFLCTLLGQHEVNRLIQLVQEVHPVDSYFRKI